MHEYIGIVHRVLVLLSTRWTSRLE